MTMSTAHPAAETELLQARDFCEQHLLAYTDVILCFWLQACADLDPARWSTIDALSPPLGFDEYVAGLVARLH